MEQFDIDAYLDGSLSGEALKAFETEMRNNPTFAERVNFLRQLTGDIEMATLAGEVKNILKEEDGNANNKQKPTRWLGLLVGVFLFCAAGYFLMGKAKNDIAAPAVPNDNQEIIPTNEPANVSPTEQPTNVTEPKTPESKSKIQQPAKPARPIAQNNPSKELPPPLHPSPNVRGQNADNAAWQAMLDKVWYTDFPPAKATFSGPFAEAAELLKERNFKKAYVKLELLEMKMEASDTLRFLKGYCLLEMGEGGDAVRYFDQLENPPNNWQGPLQWYRALGILISKGIPDAVPAFKKIAADPTHPFRLQSAKAVEVLEG